MADNFPVVKVAAVQAVSPFLDREAATAKACDLIREAGRNGAELVVFPEGFIPSHPNWYHHHLATGAASMDFLARLFANSVEVPGQQVAALGAAARAAGTHVVMGICEKQTGTLGTMYNSQLWLGPDGSVIGRHRKLMPTAAERLAHAAGHGDTFGVVPTRHGPMSGLICGENGNPLAVFALTAGHTRIHAMSWPPYVGPTAAPVRSIAEIMSRSFAEVSAAFVVSACGVLDEATLAALAPPPEHEDWLRRPGSTGGSVIVGPSGAILAGPMGNEEGILYADCDIAQSVRRKLSRDYAGHYNRPDVFRLTVNRHAPQIYETVDAPPCAAAPEPEQRD